MGASGQLDGQEGNRNCKDPEVEIYIQEVYWGVILGSTPVGSEEGIVQREGVMYETISAKPFVDLTEKDGTE